jgi:hypothetical protein
MRTPLEINRRSRCPPRIAGETIRQFPIFSLRLNNDLPVAEYVTLAQVAGRRL